MALLASGAYFLLTSSMVVRAVVLPRLSRALRIPPLQAGSISLQGLSRLELRQVKLAGAKGPPLFEAPQVVIKLSLPGLFMGDYSVPEVRIESPVLSVAVDRDGKSNLDSAMAADAGPRVYERFRWADLTLDLGTLVITNGTYRYSVATGAGISRTTELTGLELRLDRLANDAPGKLVISGQASQIAPDGSAEGTSRLGARFNASLQYKFGKRFQPESFKGGARLEVVTATGVYREVSGLSGTLNCDVDPAEGKKQSLSVRFSQAGKDHGAVEFSGSIDFAKAEARLRWDAIALDEHALTVLVAPWGLHVNSGSLSGGGVLDLSRGGEMLAITAQSAAKGLSLHQGVRSTPVLDLSLDTQFTVNKRDDSAMLSKLEFEARKESRSLAKAKLDSSVYLSWGQAPPGVNDAGVELILDAVDLREWTLPLGTNAPTGQLSGNALISCQQDGRRISAAVNLLATNVAWTSPAISNRWFQLPPTSPQQASLVFQSSVVMSDYRGLLLEKFDLRMTERGTPMISVAGSAGADFLTGDVNLQMVAESDLARLLDRFPVSGLTASSGRINIDGLVARDHGQPRATLTVALDTFTGRYHDCVFANHELRLGLDGEYTDKSLTLRRAQLLARQGSESFGGVEINGRFDRQLNQGDFTLVIENLSESGLGPFVNPWIAPAHLLSASIDGRGSLRMTNAAAALTFETEMKSLRFEDPQGMLPRVPLNLQAQLAAGYQSNQIQLTEATLALPTTPRARNALVAQGHLDFPPRQPMAGELKLRAEAIELSDLFQAFITNRPPAQPARTSTPAVATPSRSLTGLPVGQIKADLQVDRLFIREIVVTNWTASSLLTSNQFVLSPFRFWLNGGPVTGKGSFDFRQTGIGYEAQVELNQVPLAPLSDTLSPERSSKLAGKLNAKIQFAGDGLALGTTFRPTSGRIEASLNELDWGWSDLQLPLADSLFNETLAALARLSGTNREAVAVTIDQLRAPRLENLSLQAQLGADHLALERLFVQTPALRLETQGTAGWGPHTLQLPVRVAIQRDLASKAGLFAVGGASTQTYVQLPDVLNVEGTWESPRVRPGQPPPGSGASAKP